MTLQILSAPANPAVLCCAGVLIADMPGYFLWEGKDSRGNTLGAKRTNMSPGELAALCNNTGNASLGHSWPATPLSGSHGATCCRWLALQQLCSRRSSVPVCCACAAAAHCIAFTTDWEGTEGYGIVGTGYVSDRTGFPIAGLLRRQSMLGPARET